MTVLRLVLGDQLSESLASLRGADKDRDVVLMCEVMEEAVYVPHHPQKLIFIFSAMRHFAAELEVAGFRVRYVRQDDPLNTHSFTGEVGRVVAELKPRTIALTEPGEYRVLRMMRSWGESFATEVKILPDTRFLSSHAEFAAWVKGRRQLRMEYFYRDMRKKYGILLDPSGAPEGGVWNYDKENRKPMKSGVRPPPRLRHPRSSVTSEVVAMVKERFSGHFGDAEPFQMAVTRAQAMAELDHFIEHFLPCFGDYQDAMVTGEPYLFHALISSYLNAGLLTPLEICRKAEFAYHDGEVPLNAAEGFIRQILGWREYVRGVYGYYMPEYAERNALNAVRPLPAFYWTGKTSMFCVAETVNDTRKYAYSHHIRRLMITGNFALLAGLDVKEVQAWYLAVYSDAYEWVEMPNTLGMALYGDGGVMASKPYAAGGKYIHKMSDYCAKCRYDPNEMTGENACPFNALYWHFMARHEDKLRGNARIPYVYATWERFAPEKRRAIVAQGEYVLARMERGEL